MSKFQTKIKKQYESEGWIVINTIKLSANGYPDLFTLKPLQKFRIDELIKNGFKAFCLKKDKGIIYPKQITNE